MITLLLRLQISRSKTQNLPRVNAGFIKHTFSQMEDFVVTCQLVLNVPHLISGSCSSLRAFGLDYLRTLPHDNALALLLAFGSAFTWHGDFHPVSSVPCPAHTLQTAAGVPALSGVLSLKIFPRGSQLSEHGALNSDGSLSRHVKAVGLLRDKLRDYHYSSRISGSFDDESQVWVEKFQSGNKELYVFFKPFRYVQGNTIMLDGQTLNYSLTLPKTPISVVLTDISGSTSTVPLAQTLNLAGENSPKFLEVTYP